MAIFPSARHGPVELEVANVVRDDVMNDLVRVHLKYRPFSRAGQVIVIKCNGKKLRLAARGPKAGQSDKIGLDSEARSSLGLKPGDKVWFEFCEACFWDEWLWAWSATDAMPRVAARLGLFSILLGLLGLGLGIWSVVLSWHPPT